MTSNLKKYWFRAKNKICQWSTSDPLMIAPYLSYANDKEIIIRGRVLENEGVIVQEDDGKWENFINSVKRMESDEAEAVRVLIEYEDNQYECITNDEGFFSYTIPIKTTQTNQGDLQWSKAKISLLDVQSKNGHNIEAEADILLPHKQSQFGIITDIDDTILQSHVNSFLKLRLLYETFLKNAHSRLPFEHIGKVLHKISKNQKGNNVNPIFLLSHSPWNLYELLIQFLEENNIPKGPFFLRDFGYKKGKEKYEFENHKALAIEHLLNFYPNLNFVLLGDATEHDVDIYTQVYKHNSSRIIKIIIRETEKEKRNNHVREVMAQNPNAPIYLIAHSDEILDIVGENCYE